MKNTLIDAGPLIALFDKSDKYHKKVLEFLKKYKGSLITTWPVITETTHMLDFNLNSQLDFLKWTYNGGLTISSLDHDDIKRIIELTEKYSNIPMDLADASLVVTAEKEGIKTIVAIDSDYHIYRTLKNEYLKNLIED